MANVSSRDRTCMEPMRPTEHTPPRQEEEGSCFFLWEEGVGEDGI